MAYLLFALLLSDLQAFKIEIWSWRLVMLFFRKYLGLNVLYSLEASPAKWWAANLARFLAWIAISSKFGTLLSLIYAFLLPLVPFYILYNVQQIDSVSMPILQSTLKFQRELQPLIIDHLFLLKDFLEVSQSENTIDLQALLYLLQILQLRLYFQSREGIVLLVLLHAPSSWWLAL